MNRPSAYRTDEPPDRAHEAARGDNGQVALALENLYAQLSPAQREIADQQAARFMRKHRG